MNMQETNSKPASHFYSVCKQCNLIYDRCLSYSSITDNEFPFCCCIESPKQEALTDLTTLHDYLTPIHV